MNFLSRYSAEEVRMVHRFMREFNGYLEGQIAELAEPK